MADMTCPECDTTLVRVDRAPDISVAGILGGLIIFTGLIVLLFNILYGMLTIIIGILICLVNDKKTWLTCPKCKKDMVKL